MKVTFREDHQSVLSGHSFYAKGAQADLRKGDELVRLGICYEGWGKAPALHTVDAVAEDTGPIVSDISLDDLSLNELREMAKDAGIKSYHRMKKETLIERLTNADN